MRLIARSRPRFGGLCANISILGRFLPVRPRSTVDLGQEPELTKIVWPDCHRLAAAGAGKLSEDSADARLVAKFSRILDARDERIAQLEAEIARLGGSVPSVTKRATVAATADAAYVAHLRRVAATDSDPERRLRAAAVLEQEVVFWKLGVALLTLPSRRRSRRGCGRSSWRRSGGVLRRSTRSWSCALGSTHSSEQRAAMRMGVSDYAIDHDTARGWQMGRTRDFVKENGELVYDESLRLENCELDDPYEDEARALDGAPSRAG